MHWWQILFAVIFWTLYALRRHRRKHGVPDEPPEGGAGFSPIRNRGGF